MPKSIDITPDFINLFHQFLRDAVGHANQTLHLAKAKAGYADELSRMRNFVVSLNIAAQSMTTKAAVERFREELNKLSTAFALADDAAKDQVEDDDENDPLDGRLARKEAAPFFSCCDDNTGDY